tara:strand:+ start:3040 stop:3258 length:219 start_codon:yes stop_codon:yes gene_type:complete
MSRLNLKSSVNEVGDKITQIIHFSGGNKRTFSDILSTQIVQGQFTKLYQEDGTLIMVNDKNVDCIEVFKQEN